MHFNFAFKPVFLSSLSLGTLLSCGGSGGNDNSNELPYTLPNGTKITIICGAAEGGTSKITDIDGDITETPLTPVQLANINWTTRTFSLTVAADGIGFWQIFSIATGSQFAYTRTSPTTFNLSASWSGGSMTFTQCEVPSVSSTYGTFARWECWQSSTVVVNGGTESIYLFGGGTGDNQLQYERSGY